MALRINPMFPECWNLLGDTLLDGCVAKLCVDLVPQTPVAEMVSLGVCKGPKDMGSDPAHFPNKDDIKSMYIDALREASQKPLPAGTTTVTPTDCFVRALAVNEHDKLLVFVWNGLARSMIRAKIDVVSVKGKS